MTTVYGDISPRTAAYASKQLLERAIPFLVIEQFGQAKPLPTNSSKTMKFRRYNSLAFTPKVLSEGVTPDATSLTVSDITATLAQVGDRITVSDVITDTHEDPVLSEASDVLSEQAANMVEAVRFGIIKAGTNVFFANGSARTDVNTAVSLTMQRKITRALKNQNAKKVTKVVAASANYNTSPVQACYVGMCHPNLEADIRSMPGFVSVEHYGQITPFPSEIGKVEDVRYVTSTIFEPWEDAGGDKGTMLSTTGTKADVYPIIYVGADAYGLIALKGKYAVIPMVVNAKPSDSDPMAQRSHVSWKTMQTAVILNDLWMARAEVAVSAL